MSHRAAPFALALALLAAPAAAQEVLDGTYTFVRLRAEWTQECGAASTSSFSSVAVGELAFLPNGTVSSTTTYQAFHSSATFTSCTNTGGAGPFGTYVLDATGALVLTLAGQAPATHRLSPDRDVIVSGPSPAGTPTLLVAVRQEPTSAATLAGDYAFMQIGDSTLCCGLGFDGWMGACTFDGAGGAQWQGAKGSFGAVLGGPGTYAVGPSGSLSLAGFLALESFGVVSGDGRIAVVGERTGAEVRLSVYLRRPTAPLTPSPLAGGWWLAEAGSDTLSTSFPPDVEQFSIAGAVFFDAAAGTRLVGAQRTWSDGNGGGAAPLVDTAPFAIDPSGLFDFGGATVPGALSSAQIPGRLGDGEELAFYADIKNGQPGSCGLLVRAWGALAGDAGAISAAFGGTQTLTLRATAQNGGLVYLVGGSISGSYPGVALLGETVPLNFDAYTQQTLAAPNAPPLGQSLGVLDAFGRGTATFTLPAGSSPALVGLELRHAAIVVDPTLPSPLRLVTNAVPVRIET